MEIVMRLSDDLSQFRVTSGDQLDATLPTPAVLDALPRSFAEALLAELETRQAAAISEKQEAERDLERAKLQHDEAAMWETTMTGGVEYMRTRLVETAKAKP